MRGSRLIVVAIAIFALGVGAAVYALAKYNEAYGFVEHTSDVRLVIGRAIGHSASTSSCGDLSADVRELDWITEDNPTQQDRVLVIRADVERLCNSAGSAGDINDIMHQLTDADATERSLMRHRSGRLYATRAWAIGAFVGSLVAALTIVAAALVLQRRALKGLVDSETRFRLLAANATDLIRIHDPTGQALYVTPSCERLLGFTSEEMLAAPPATLSHPDDRKIIGALMETLAQGGYPKPITHRLRRRDGEFRWFETEVRPIHDAVGKLQRFYSTARDITERVEAERKLEAIAVTDELTGLHNRRGFSMMAGQQYRVAVRQGHGVAIVFADLDGLKPINDNLGHEYGDQAIRELAEILRATFRDSDVLARLGGDEFAVLAYDVARVQVESLLARLRAAIAERNRMPGRKYVLSASLGVSVLETGQKRTLDEMIAEADARMYEHKREGKESGRIAAIR